GIKDNNITFKLGMTKIQKEQMQEFLDKYQDIFAHELTQLRRTTVVQHEIHVEKRPSIKQKYYLTSKL
ncbi:23791_t:CDS:1, partial [Gigaspora margarita]